MKKSNWFILATLLLLLLAPTAPAADKAYLTLAESLASPLFQTTDEANKTYTDPGVMLRMEIAWQRLQVMTAVPLELTAIRTNALQTLDTCHTSMLKLRELNNNIPDIEGVAKKTLTAAPGLVKAARKKNLDKNDKQAVNELALKVGAEIFNAVVNSYKTSSEMANYRTAYARTRSRAYSDLGKVFLSQYKNVPRAKGGTLGVSITGSWCNTYTCDWVSLRNDSGKDLTNCTLFVMLSGTNAKTGQKESDSHLHFVANWPKGKLLYARYPSRVNSGLAQNESVDCIRSAKIVLASDQYTDEISYTYEGKHLDSDLKRSVTDRLKPATFTGRWYNYESHRIYNNGFQLTYNGSLPSFPASYVTVTVKEGVREKSLRWRIANQRMSFGAAGKQWLSDDAFNSFKNPDSVLVQLEFPNSTYKHELFWQYKKK